MPDPNRIYDGFTVLTSGVNGGVDPSLIQLDQVAAAVNFTFRGGMASTRPGWIRRNFNMVDARTQTDWAGIFQGATFYQQQGFDGFVVSRGGRLFRFTFGATIQVSEITPQVTVVVVNQFTVPALNGSVVVNVNEAAPLTIGLTVFIDGGNYSITAISGDALTVTYHGSAAHGTVAAGVSVLSSTGALIIAEELNPATYDLIYLFQGENYAFVMGGQHPTVVYDGSTARQLRGPDDLPPGNLGIYVWGRVWIVQPDGTTFIAGDIVFGSSGTAQLGYRDAILHVTENDFLNEGGTFGVPVNAGQIAAMFALATQDTSLGVGNLLVGTPNTVFSVNTPPDRTVWKNLTYPIQTVSLIDYGPVAPRGGVAVNGDWWFRSPEGIRSFQVARRNINTVGNAPLSREVAPILANDSRTLLPWCSGFLFDNRLYFTVAPYRTTVGVAHQGLVCVNFDLISSLAGKSNPAWEGLVDGLNVLQMLKGTVDGVERAFMFALNGTTIELWEMSTNLPFDEPGVNIPIQSWLETRYMNAGDSTQLKLLTTGELYLDQIVNSVTVKIQWRPDQSPIWNDWSEFVVCGTVNNCAAPTDCLGGFGVEQYATRLLLPKPMDPCEAIGGMPANLGYTFQFRIEITGHCRIRQFKAHFTPQPDFNEGDCPTDQACTTVAYCPENWFTYSSIS